VNLQRIQSRPGVSDMVGEKVRVNCDPPRRSETGRSGNPAQLGGGVFRRQAFGLGPTLRWIVQDWERRPLRIDVGSERTGPESGTG
jgi:hypothetical protein